MTLLIEWQFYLVLLLLVAMMYCFVKEIIAPELTTAVVVSILLISQILDIKEVLSVFSSSAPVTIACMFVISASLEKTGCINTLGNALGRFTGNDPKKILLGLMLCALFVSSFMNNTPVVVILTPVAVMLAKKANISASKILIPLSYTIILGGTLTMIGTSTNILVDGVAQRHGLEPMSIFSITLIGAILAAVGVIYLFIFSFKLLPDIDAFESETKEHKERMFLIEVVIPSKSYLIGLTLLEIQENILREILHNNSLFKVNKWIRQAKNEMPIIIKNQQEHLLQGDLLVIESTMDVITYLKVTDAVKLYHSPEHYNKQERQLFEIIITNGSRYNNRPIADLDLTSRYNISILGIHRHDQRIFEHFDDFRFNFGDVLVVEGEESGVKRFVQNGDLIVLNSISDNVYRKDKAPISLFVCIAVITLSAFNIMPIAALSMIGATIVTLGKCIDIDKAYQSINWNIIMLIFGMLAVSIAMDKVGLIVSIVNSTLSFSIFTNPIVLIMFLYFITSFLTEIISNSAVSLLMAPIAIQISNSLTIDSRPLVLAVLFASSASLATPIGYQTNTFVYNVGGYKFIDFIKIGLPLKLLLWIVCTISLSIIYL